MEKSKLRSSRVENVCVLIDFIYENDLVALGRKTLLKKDGLALGRWYPFERKKLNAHGRKKKK